MASLKMVENLEIGRAYSRPELSRIWGLAGHQAISRGVYTPSGQNVIFLFVTRIKQNCLTQYDDFIQDDLLFWEGEKGHGSDERIASASSRGEQIHLFYRDCHHTLFTYQGKIALTHWLRHEGRPSEFVFRIASLGAETSGGTLLVAEGEEDYRILSARAVNGIDRQVVARTRGIAQRVFRGNVFRLWDGACAVTGVREPSVLKAGHIKPWAEARIEEKGDHFNGLLLIPNLDTLFDEGLISFREDGSVMVSNRWDREDQRRMHITPDLHLRNVFAESQPYLEYHRNVRFKA